MDTRVTTLPTRNKGWSREDRALLARLVQEARNRGFSDVELEYIEPEGPGALVVLTFGDSTRAYHRGPWGVSCLTAEGVQVGGGRTLGAVILKGWWGGDVERFNQWRFA